MTSITWPPSRWLPAGSSHSGCWEHRGGQRPDALVAFLHLPPCFHGAPSLIDVPLCDWSGGSSSAVWLSRGSPATLCPPAPCSPRSGNATHGCLDFSYKFSLSSTAVSLASPHLNYLEGTGRFCLLGPWPRQNSTTSRLDLTRFRCPNSESVLTNKTGNFL